MRGPIWLLLVGAMLGGCVSIGDLLAPAPTMAPPRTATAGSEELPAATTQPAPAVKEPVPAPAPPRPAVPAPLATPPASPPPPSPPPPPPRTAAIPREPPVLAPQASAEEEQRLKTQAERRIEGTEKLVQRIDPARLPREQQENYRTIQSFLVKAREALSTRDVQRAFTLADKAYFLADEMSKAPR
jgi:outer membrane biosynthesis protein TonB